MRYAIGLDIGGTQIRGGIVSDSGKILKLASHPTESKQPRRKVLDNIIRVIDALRNGDNIDIGIGAPGFALPNGKMTSIENIPGFMGFNLKKALERRLKKKIVIENDTNCFALGEYRYGAGKISDNMAGIILGTGVGAGLVLDGALYTGKGGAGEPGHSYASLLGRKYCRYCSGNDLAKRYKKDAKELFSKMSRSNKKAVDEFYSNLGLMLSQIMNLLDIDLFVLGGGVSQSVNISKLKRVTDRYTYPSFRKRFKIVKQKLKYPGVMGAAGLVL